MGVVSDAVLDAGGHLTGIIPYAMVAAGGEKAKTGEAEPEELTVEGKSGTVSTALIIEIVL